MIFYRVKVEHFDSFDKTQNNSRRWNILYSIKYSFKYICEFTKSFIRVFRAILKNSTN